jgi:hypothetical protein
MLHLQNEKNIVGTRVKGSKPLPMRGLNTFPTTYCISIFHYTHS